MWCGCGTHYLGVWLVGGAFVPEGPLKKLAPMVYIFIYIYIYQFVTMKNTSSRIIGNYWLCR